MDGTAVGFCLYHSNLFLFLCFISCTVYLVTTFYGRNDDLSFRFYHSRNVFSYVLAGLAEGGGRRDVKEMIPTTLESSDEYSIDMYLLLMEN